MPGRINWYLATTVLLWALNFSAVKLMVRELDVPTITLLRTVITAVFFWIVLALQKERKPWPSTKFRLIVLLQGALSTGIYMILFLEGIAGTTESAAAIIMATSPLMTALLSMALRHEPFRRQAILGALIAMIGIFVVFESGPGRGSQVMGNLLVFVAAMVWAISVIMLRPLLRESTPIQITAQGIVGGLLCILPYGLGPTLRADYAHLSSTTWLALLFTSVLSGGVAFLTYYRGLHDIGAARATLYQYLVPPSAIILGHFILSTPLLLNQGLGLLIVLAGVVVGNQTSTRSKLVT